MLTKKSINKILYNSVHRGIISLQNVRDNLPIKDTKAKSLINRAIQELLNSYPK